MRGAIPPVPNTSLWRGAQVKHRDNSTFTFTHFIGGWVIPRAGLDAVEKRKMSEFELNLN
jgi:hypothetical protein